MGMRADAGNLNWLVEVRQKTRLCNVDLSKIQHKNLE